MAVSHSIAEGRRHFGPPSTRGITPWLSVFLKARKNKRLEETQDEPNCQKRKTFQRKAFELEEEFRDQKSYDERGGLSLESYLHTEFLDQRKHWLLPNRATCGLIQLQVFLSRKPLNVAHGRHPSRRHRVQSDSDLASLSKTFGNGWQQALQPQIAGSRQETKHR
jgi:hypothetical protein